MPGVGPWKKIGGSGWAAVDAHLRGSKVNGVDPFPPLTSTTNNARSLNVAEAVDHPIQRHREQQQQQHNQERQESVRAFPIEPEEWEEGDDDMYLRHRRDALRASRKAARHSEAAARAFWRGDHESAWRHSVAAGQHHSAAQSLHADAASAISSLRNPISGDPSTLDLHGLHAPEALCLLRHRLRRLETLLSRPAVLHVVTGVGNHSRGLPALPAAVKDFLCQLGYYFQETRPGVISVRPKFRSPT